MDDLTRAKKYALYLLTDMDRTEQQLRDKLAKKDYSDEIIEETIRYVKSFGYIDDSRYIRHFTECSLTGKSLRRIKNDLMKKGLDRNLIDETIQDMDEIDERPLIRKLAEKKYRSLKDEDPNRYRKTAQFLAGKGFSSGDIFSVLDDLKAEFPADDYE